MKLAMYEIDAICQRIVDTVKPEKEKQFWKRYKASAEVKKLHKLQNEEQVLKSSLDKVNDKLNQKREEANKQAAIVRKEICKENDVFRSYLNNWQNSYKREESYTFDIGGFFLKVKNRVVVATLGKTTDIEAFIQELIKEFI